jgi:hypothetical protein
METNSSKSSQTRNLGRQFDQLIWIGPIASLLFVGAILAVFGVTLWTMIIVILAIACPVAGLSASDAQETARKPR